MRKVSGIKFITRLYFASAILLSFIHLVEAGRKGGLTWEAWTVPFMVDGIAVMGLVMRSADFASRTRRIGFRVQIVAGGLSLIGNVYAAHNVGTAMFGVAVVSLFVFSEWLSDQIESAVVEEARIATEEAAAKKAASIAKAQATRKRNTRTRKAETKVLEKMLNA
jgi:hypothetical protein